MLNFNRNPADAKDAGKSGLKPALYEPPTSTARGASTGAPLRQQGQAAAPTRELAPAATPPTLTDAVGPATPARAAGAAASSSGETAGSKLFIGVNIKLKGVEISDC